MTKQEVIDQLEYVIKYAKQAEADAHPNRVLAEYHWGRQVAYIAALNMVREISVEHPEGSADKNG